MLRASAQGLLPNARFTAWQGVLQSSGPGMAALPDNGRAAMLPQVDMLPEPRVGAGLHLNGMPAAMTLGDVYAHQLSQKRL